MKRFRSFGVGVLAFTMTFMPVLEFASAAPETNENPFSVQIQTAIIQSLETSMTTGGEVEQDVAIGNDGTEAPVTVEPATTEEPTSTPEATETPEATAEPTETPAPTETPVVDDEDKADEATTKITSTTLTPGTTSEEVRILQERLMELNYMESDLPTGFYGSITKEAIQYFQRANKLKIDGVAGEETLKLLFSGDAKKYTIFPGDSGSDVSSLQRRLKALNYFDGNVTGFFGSETTSAVKAFQKANKLTADGVVGTRTRERLYSEKAVEAPETSKPSKPSSTPKPTQKPSTPGKDDNDGSMSANVSNFLKVAKAQQGKRYVLGAEGPNSFDCSGFVYYCLRSVGVSTGRLSAQGYANTTKWPSVSTSSLKAGDLLFFSDGGSRITHTGIYIGGGQMIHASSGQGKVIISSIQTSYWQKNLRSARRVF
ncbi:MAG: peptidoglycan-binding protein [Clostridiales bacterium]|nr:peptidoglycan-binding protein [Clostridiales bacterium]